MIESAKRNLHRLLRNFTFLVVLQFNLEIVAVPFYYVMGLFQWGWYAPSLWQYKLMIEEPGLFISRYAMFALLVLIFWEFGRAIYVISRYAITKTKISRIS